MHPCADGWRPLLIDDGIPYCIRKAIYNNRLRRWDLVTSRGPIGRLQMVHYRPQTPCQVAGDWLTFRELRPAAELGHFVVMWCWLWGQKNGRAGWRLAKTVQNW